ncbi:MAG TPA: DinB family protein [Pyrinomonadaceae bacterium]|nr:DinB family protein [Pyrinomonadaceae bacterium]
MTKEDLRLEEALAVLERTPAAVRALLDGLPETWVRATEGERTWSPYDVVGHLVHGERADWMGRARHILSGDPSPFTPFDRGAQFRESKGKSLQDLLAEFTELRGRNVAELRELQLGREDLGRVGRHPDFGEVTLGKLLAAWVVHDLDHVAQIARTMAKVYTDAVGPWAAYLSILRDRQK